MGGADIVRCEELVILSAPLETPPRRDEVTLAVEAADRLARLEGFAPETLALELAARFERSALDVTFFTGAMIQPSTTVATLIVKPVPAPR
jgi:hypothetical protein